MARMNDRGQILLIGALVMAATFISLGVVLNGSLHTPSIAAEASDDVTAGEVTGIRDTLERETAGLMKTARTKHPDDWPLQSSWVRNNVTTLGHHLEQYYARQDVAVSFGVVNPIEGREYTGSIDDDSGTGIPDSIDVDTTEARRFVLKPTLSGSERVTIDITEVPTGPAHTIEVGASQLSVGGSTCSYNNRIGIMNASTDVKPCPALAFVNDLGTEYDIDVSASGGSSTYEILYRGTGPGTEVVYEVEIPYTVDSTTLHFTGTIEIDPGEP